MVFAALFSPLRRRIQSGIDRRFYPQKYDTEKMLKAFTLVARDEVEIEKLAGQLLSAVEETLHPDEASLWVYRTSGGNYWSKARSR